MRRQCRLMSLNRSALYYEPKGESEENLQLMRRLDEQFLETPYYGSRQMVYHLKRQGYVVGRKRIRRLMAQMGLAVICQRPRTSQPHPENRVYPYLLRGLAVTRPDQVWCADVTYIPMRRGFLYLVAIMDWYSRRVLSWRLSNTLQPSFCCEALEEALNRYDPPEIFNTDQGSQFTSTEFTGLLKEAGVRISMDGRGRWMDNIFIERLWRSLKYECVYLNAFETGSQARQGIGHWMNRYNSERPHSAHAGATPEEGYTGLDKKSERGPSPSGSPPLRIPQTGGNKNYGVHLRNAAEWSGRWGPPLNEVPALYRAATGMLANWPGRAWATAAAIGSSWLELAGVVS